MCIRDSPCSKYSGLFWFRNYENSRTACKCDTRFTGASAHNWTDISLCVYVMKVDVVSHSASAYGCDIMQEQGIEPDKPVCQHTVVLYRVISDVFSALLPRFCCVSNCSPLWT